MEPWQSWAAFVVIGGSASYYYLATKQRGKQAAKKQPQAIAEKPQRKKLNGELAAGSGSDKASSKNERRRKTSPGAPLAVEKPAQWVGSEDDRTQEDKDKLDREFAKAMAGMKTAPRPTNGKPQPKPTIAPLPVVEAAPSLTSSATGGEADDDLSSTGSPSFRPTAGDVSDMLEAPAPAAAVLRLTEPEKPVQTRAKQEKSFQVQETKKQRQNRKKAEEKKVQREAEEEERRSKMEQHLRSARQSTSSGAQARTNAASAAATNAWTKPRDAPVGALSQSNETYDEQIARETADHHHHGVPGHHGQDHVVRVTPVDAGAAQTNLLLDAFDTNTPISKKKSGGKKPEWEQGLPSEAEQLRLLSETNGWSTVETKKGKSGKKPVGGSKSGNESSGTEFKSESKFAKLKDFVTSH